MSRKLTKKQKGFVRDYAKTGNGRLAVKKNYDVVDDNTAGVIASENLTKPNVVKALADRIPDDLLEKVHLEGLEATSVRFTPEGEQIEIDDFATRHKYLDTGYKIKRLYAPDPTAGVNIQINFSTKEEEIATKYLEEVQQLDEEDS